MKLTYHDKDHIYFLAGKRVKSVSKVADIAADRFTIEQWQKRMVAVGMTLDHTLTERVAVDLDNKEAVQKVCGDAHAAAKADARANRGTQRHRVFELVLLGRDDQFVTDQQRNDAAVLRRTLDAYGLEPIPDRVEQFVAYPEHGVVGRYDAVVMYQGRPVIVDLKGGPNAVKYPHSTVTQLALYRFAPYTSAKINRDGDKSIVTEWTGWPDGLDDEVGYVIYCDDDHDVGELWALDLVHGRRSAELALSIVHWRKGKDWGREICRPVKNSGPTQPAVEESGPAKGAGDAPDEAAATSAAWASSQPTPPSDGVATPDLTMVVQRTKALVDAGHAEALAKTWPAGVPGLKSDHDHTDTELAAILAAVKRIENDTNAPFHPADNPPPPPKNPLTPPPALPPAPEEGANIDDGDYDALKKRLEALDDETVARIETVAAQASAAGTPISLRQKRSVRRLAIVLALVAWSEIGWDEDVVRDLLAAITGDDAVCQPATTLGAIFGALTIDQANQLVGLAVRVAMSPDELEHTNGRWQLNPAA